MLDPGAETTAPRGSRVRTWVKRVVLVAVLALAALAVHRNYEALGSDLGRLNWWWVSASFVPGVLAMATSLQLWRVLMSELGSPLPVRAAARIFFPSQLGKYVPGSLWSVVAQMELGREHRVPRRTSVTVGLLALVLSASAGVSLAIVLLPLTERELVRTYWWLVLVLPLLYAAMHPPVLRRVLDHANRLLRRPPMGQLPTWAGLRRALFLQLGVWVLLGLQVWMLLLALGTPVWASLPAAIGGYAVAYSLGMLAVVVPAGAGVREGVLVVALSGVTSVSGALLVALLARIASTLVDVGLAGAVLLLRRAPATPQQEGEQGAPGEQSGPTGPAS